MMLYLALIFVVIIQLVYFIKTQKDIKHLSGMFPEIEKSLSIVDCSFVESIINSKDFSSQISSLPEKSDSLYDENGEEYFTVSLLKISDSHRKNFSSFAEIVDKTNLYLCKNRGASADLDILKDICEQRIMVLESSIQNSLNVPLYCGLAGTFLGIIVGLNGVEIDSVFTASSNSVNLDGIQDLLTGIVFAMIASLVGLILTVKNSSISFLVPSYKDASRKTDQNKESYFDYLRRELMPVLAHSMASSLNSLRGVLGHFVDKFGHKLNDYADTAELLNDNLDKQQKMLDAINKLNLVKTSSKIAEAFLVLKDSSDSLNVFHDYQEHLNNTILSVSSIVSKINSATQDIDKILKKFDTFSMGLNTVVEGQYNAAELQRQFKESIETHFPIGSEGRDVWRKEYDMLVTDAQNVTKELSCQLAISTQYIQNFVSNNKDFFETFHHMREVVNVLVQYADAQSQCYNDLKSEIIGLRSDFKGSKVETIELHKSTLEAVKTMNSLLLALKN